MIFVLRGCSVYLTFGFQEVSLPVLKISSTTAVSKTKTEWAELLDTTKLIVNFDQKIPDPAVKFNFELDTFQKMVLFQRYD